MKMSSLQELLVAQLKDLYSAENQLVKALPKMAKNVTSDALREAIENHLEETRGQVERLQKIGEMLDAKLTGHKCVGMEGLIEEGAEVLEEDGPEAILDAAVVAAAQRVEHYEMAGYGTARTMAELLGQQEVVELLQQTLDEEKAADQKLTQVVESEIYPQAAASAEAWAEENGGGRAKRGGRTKAGSSR